MRTSGEKVCISDEAERVQSDFIFAYKIIVRVIHSGVFKGRQSRHLSRPQWRAEVWWCPGRLLDWCPPTKFWYWAVAYGGHCY